MLVTCTVCQTNSPYYQLYFINISLKYIYYLHFLTRVITPWLTYIKHNYIGTSTNEKQLFLQDHDFAWFK